MKVDVTKTELVWPGKYTAEGRLRQTPRTVLPFQVVERVNESRAAREARKAGRQADLYVYQGREEGAAAGDWRNQLVWGDNLLVMNSLLEKFAGKVDLIYIDPPFATGADFTRTTEIGDPAAHGGQVVALKDISTIEEKAYRDTWGRGIDSYLEMIYDRLTLMRELLSDTGSIYVHCDWRVNSYVRLMMDDIFETDNFQNEIIWCYRGMGNRRSTAFQARHDTLLVYSKDSPVFNHQLGEPTPESLKTYESARRVGYLANHARGLVTVFDWVKYKAAVKSGKLPSGMTEKEFDGGRPLVSDWWADIKILGGPNNQEILGYPTQKPEALLERIVKASSNEGMLVADFFCGSGTTLAVAERLGRRWIGCDLGRWGIHTTRKRLLGMEDCKPFELLNLGKYERQFWQSVKFNGGKQAPPTEQMVSDYFNFILKLYGAQPLPGHQHLHGKKGKALVHIGAVDAPVTVAEINDALEECAQVKQKELHILGWEWEMGLAGPNNGESGGAGGSPMHAVAKSKGVKLHLLRIPREVMEQQVADDHDVQFFELAYLEAEVKRLPKRAVQIALTDFVIPHPPESVPEELRLPDERWSDYIDYWAVDWNFRNDTFMQGWVAYRTRKERALPLASDPHIYVKPGRYRVLVKVVDIFGNDTSCAFDVEVN